MTRPARVKKPSPESQRAFARRMGCAPRAVAVAIQNGRIPRELIGERGKILDPEAAVLAWKANTRSDFAPLTGPTAPGGGGEDLSLVEVRARHELAKAQLAEIELAEKRGDLVAVAEVDAQLTGLFASCKTKLLGVPSRVRQSDPSLTVAQIALIESLVREALEDLAEGKIEVDAA